MLVALAIGAAIAGRVINHAMATCAGFARARRHFVERCENAHATRIHVFLHRALAAHALAEVGFRAILAGEEAGGERVVRNDGDVFLLAPSLLAGFEAGAIGEIVERL